MPLFAIRCPRMLASSWLLLLLQLQPEQQHQVQAQAQEQQEQQVQQREITEMADENHLCISPTNTYTTKVNIYASEMGNFEFEECPDMINPTIGMEMGQVYTFVQEDKSNYMHPLRFSYFPDGQHVGADLLTPDTKGSSITATTTNDSGGTNCAQNMTCPAPLYFLNDGYLGTYSNIPEVADGITTNEADYGWDLYLDFFLGNVPNWKRLGKFSMQLKFDDASHTQDLFYYCWAHQYMAGRIKLLRDGVPVQEKNDPPMYYQQETRSEFDQMCGTSHLEQFKLPNALCPSEFVCDVDERMREFASCIDAMNCAMMAGMTNKATSKSEVALFVHQMIPHHQNAVNMAKALLKAVCILVYLDKICLVPFFGDHKREEPPTYIFSTLLRLLLGIFAV